MTADDWSKILPSIGGLVSTVGLTAVHVINAWRGRTDPAPAPVPIQPLPRPAAVPVTPQPLPGVPKP